MFRTIIFVSALLVSVAAFRPSASMARQAVTKLSMSAEFLPGALAPLGYFDPLGFCKDKTEGEVKVGRPHLNGLLYFFASAMQTNRMLTNFNPHSYRKYANLSSSTAA